jgi:DNA-binding transcriptional LysR family regulator
MTMTVQKRSAALDWEDVRVFTALARHQTLSAAARTLKVTHATISRRLSSLETTLGEPLFTRGREGLALNAAGAEVLAEATRMESAASALSGRRSDTPGISGLVRVTVARVFADFLAERLAALIDQHPGLTTGIIATSRNLSLARREAEIALRFARPASGELVARRVATIDYGFYASPCYQQRLDAGETPAFIAFETRSDIDDVREAAWAREFLAGRRIALTANSQTAQAAAARSGVGIALLPGLLARNVGALAQVDVDAAPPARELWMLMRPDVAKLSRVRVVADHLIRTFKPHTS